MQSKTYEITFLGQAGTTLSAEFDDCEVTIGPGTTTLRADLPDRGADKGAAGSETWLVTRRPPLELVTSKGIQARKERSDAGSVRLPVVRSSWRISARLSR